jgi:(heptosyl)LPS beta-1,4-glucosyltransferase
MLTAIILTLNESAHIQHCIASLQFADDILVFDSFSSDNTIELAKNAGARVLQRKFDDYASQRNAAIDAAKINGAEWVLFIDADERVSPELAAEIQSVLDKAGYAGWRMPRHNYIFGNLTRGAGWYPDYQTRLLKVGAARYDPTRKVHEVVELDGESGTLDMPLIHHNYHDTAQFFEKQRKYTAYEARIMYEQGIRPKPQNYVLQPLRHFKWRFIELKGYIDGFHGLRLSLFMAWYELQKYVLLRRLWRTFPKS